MESGYTDLDRTGHPTDYVTRLDRVGSSEFWQLVKQLTFKLVGARPGARIVDLGCGTGDDVRCLAQLVAPHGQAVGVDSSATMIAEARKRSVGLSFPLDFVVGNVLELNFPDASFDGCRAERLFQHLDEPRQALRELVRVARPGGTAVVVEPDYGSLTIVGADPDITRRILASRIDHFRSGRIGSQLPGLFKEVGFKETAITIKRLGSRDAVQDREQLRKYATDAEAAGVISVEAGTRWLRELDTAGQRGGYLHTIAVFIVSGTRRKLPRNLNSTQ
jgi:SAM-dependent methyltransferase